MININNLEIIDASIEVFGCILCLVLAITIKMNNPRTKSMRTIIFMMSTVALLFLGQAFALIFRGNIGTADLIITRVANFAVFILNLVLANYYVRFVHCMARENDIQIREISLWIINILSIVGTLIPVVNIFTDWMYYFDDENYYHRNYMWYVYTLIMFAIIGVGVFEAFKHGRELKKRKVIAAFSFAIFPLIAMALQFFIYGISLINIGLGVGVIALMVFYLLDWLKNKDELSEDTTKKKKWPDMAMLFIIMVMSMSAAIITFIASINSISSDNSKIQSTTIGHMVSSGLESEFIKPITVSETLSKDYSLKAALEWEAVTDRVNDVITSSMRSVKDGFGYQMVFTASEKTKAYYSYDKIEKYLDEENDAHDVWYTDFKKSGKHYELNVDTDETNGMDLAVFVNTEIRGKDGEFLGACGVGVDMNQLIEDINYYESQYNIRVNLVNKDGLIQVDSDLAKIETESVDNSYFDKVKSDEFYYQYGDDGCVLTKYIDSLGWYLVVTDYSPQKIDVIKIVVPSIIIFVAGLLIMAVAFLMITIREHKAENAYIEKVKVSITDELTGLFNRRGFENEASLIRASKENENYAIIMMDLNGLKFVNDNIGHEAGDELIIGSAHCMDNAFSNLGKVFRTGGDEFVAILRGSKDDINSSIDSFIHILSIWKGKYINELSTSMGVVFSEDYYDKSFDELMTIADKLMYADKDAYYKRTGKERRKG